MHVAFPGLGTVINIVAVVAGALLGMWVGHRIPERTRSVVTDCLGLTTLLVAGLSTVSVTDAALRDAVGPGVPCLLYTSDAADERSSVDLGGRRILKKKKLLNDG